MFVLRTLQNFQNRGVPRSAAVSWPFKGSGISGATRATTIFPGWENWIREASPKGRAQERELKSLGIVERAP